MCPMIPKTKPVVNNEGFVQLPRSKLKGYTQSFLESRSAFSWCWERKKAALKKNSLLGRVEGDLGRKVSKRQKEKFNPMCLTVRPLASCLHSSARLFQKSCPCRVAIKTRTTGKYKIIKLHYKSRYSAIIDGSRLYGHWILEIIKRGEGQDVM